MSRREIVLLVSRAIALLQLITALLDAFITLPQQLFFLSQQLRMESQFRANSNFPQMQHHLSPIAMTGLAVTVVRIVALLIIAAVFWNCGPTIERWLLPTGNAQPDEMV